jgi:hypothetical protein
VDSNVHLWDQSDTPVFWLSDRTLVGEMLGDYNALPDRYALDDYLARRPVSTCVASGRTPARPTRWPPRGGWPAGARRE